MGDYCNFLLHLLLLHVLDIDDVLLLDGGGDDDADADDSFEDPESDCSDFSVPAFNEKHFCRCLMVGSCCS